MNFKHKLLFATIATTFSLNASAQMPGFLTINVQDVLNRMYTMAGFNGVTGSITSLNSTTQEQMKQTAQNQQDTDMRNRYSAYQNNLLNQTGGTIKPQPTLQDCINATPKKDAGTAGVRAAGGGGSNKFTPTSSNAKGPELEAEINKKIIADKGTKQTCVPNDDGVSGCSGDNYGNKAAADWHPRGYDCNSEGRKMVGDPTAKPDDTLCTNYTFNADNWELTQKNVMAQAGYVAPKRLNKKQNEANNNYDAYISILNAKLTAAQEALLVPARLRQAPTEDFDSGSYANKLWNNGESYKTITGLETKPDKPSFYDIVNYGVYNGVFGASKNTLDIDELNKRVALNNLIMWKQYQLLEQSNKILANILTQQIAPVTMGNADQLYKDTKQKASDGK